MLSPRWIARACWIPWVILVSVWIQGTTGESEQPTCLTRHWRKSEAALLEWPMCIETRWERKPIGGTNNLASPTTGVRTVTRESTTVSVPSEAASPPASESAVAVDQELDTDSPLDNANFLSFEDWRKQNLAKAGQSAENVGGSRRTGTAGKDRRRPTGINDALDSLGDDAEIELDFGGFGADPSEAAKSATPWSAKVIPGGDGVHFPTGVGGRDGGFDAPEGHAIPHAGGPRSKDAGTTCKERFNYASFDCAATVLKTNPEAKGSSSVLIENKDSYMLNECRAQNKFLILELCDDILVDTVVLANYEFFSSIFHTFRVSVTDRYPAKPDQWKELGVYEARNTREIQAFAVENPLIWARYLRIEFLTHYGHEYYCPLSLIRVHGTTMLEEYKHDGEASRVEEEITDVPQEAGPPAGDNTATEDDYRQTPKAADISTGELEMGTFIPEICSNFGTTVELVLQGLRDPDVCGIHDTPAKPTTGSDGGIPSVPGQLLPSTVVPSTGEASSLVGGGTMSFQEPRDSKVPGPVGINVRSSANSALTTTVSEAATYHATSETDSRSTNASNKDEQGGAATESTRGSATQPPSANPTTQESFFKSVNKRLQMLETNSSLSLQYIEEQSRILRDAFSKVEKRQLSKTSTFLESLNVTVLNELRQFREQYDHVWKSVALEFEHQRVQYHQEIYSLSAQLGVVADELVFQKRVAVIQSIVVLFCFGLVLFTRGAASGYIELPSMQSMVSRSYSLRSPSPIFGSPPGSPGSTRPTSSYRGGAGHRRELSDDDSRIQSIGAALAYAPPTPTSDDSNSDVAVNGPKVRLATPSEDSQSVAEVAPRFLRSNSSPPDLNGGNEENEGREEEEEEESECSDADKENPRG